MFQTNQATKQGQPQKPARASSKAKGRSKAGKAAGTVDVYQRVTDTLLAALENCGPWERPWLGAGGSSSMPINAATGRQYRGSNVVMLWMTAMERGYSRNLWGTFKQWQDKGAQVRKGESGTPIMWFSILERETEQTEQCDAETKRIPFARCSFVFNADQVDGYEACGESAEVQTFDPIERAEALMLASGVKIAHNGASAFYRPGTDEIVLPPREAFVATSTATAAEGYYGTALHELVHWSGAKTRLDRDLTGRFGSDSYAAEELVAELGSAFLCASLGVSLAPRPDHAAYLREWIKILRNDKKAFVTAASKASQASDYLLALINVSAPADIAANTAPEAP